MNSTAHRELDYISRLIYPNITVGISTVLISEVLPRDVSAFVAGNTALILL